MNRRRKTAFLASVLLALLAHGGCGGGNSANTTNGDSENRQVRNCGGNWESLPLEDLPERDPEALWPRDGMRMAWAEFWISWRTKEHSRCRLLLTRDLKTWQVGGESTAFEHYQQANLAEWNSQVTFCVEFEEEGKRWRSRPRTVVFGKGARFSGRELHVEIAPEGTTQHSLRLEGRNPVRVGAGGWKHAGFPEDVWVGYAPQPGDDEGGEVLLIVQGEQIPAEGCAGYLEVFDPVGRTYDRVRIVLSHKP